MLAERPVVGDQIGQGERHGEGAQEDVGDCKVRNEDVPSSHQDLTTELKF